MFIQVMAYHETKDIQYHLDDNQLASPAGF